MGLPIRFKALANDSGTTEAHSKTATRTAQLCKPDRPSSGPVAIPPRNSSYTHHRRSLGKRQMDSQSPTTTHLTFRSFVAICLAAHSSLCIDHLQVQACLRWKLASDLSMQVRPSRRQPQRALLHPAGLLISSGPTRHRLVLLLCKHWDCRGRLMCRIISPTWAFEGT